MLRHLSITLCQMPPERPTASLGAFLPAEAKAAMGEERRPENRRQPGLAVPQRTKSDAAMLVAHLDAAYNLARWLMRNEAEAEDVVQDSYLRAIRHFGAFRGGDGRAWLLTIVRNGCYDRLKLNGASSRSTDFDEAVHSGGQQSPNPETAMLLAERSELVRKSLEEMPPEYREVLVLRELEQLSYREIADITGIPMGTVMSRLNRGRQRLQQTLFDYGERGAIAVVSRRSQEPAIGLSGRG
jgi:RNA polymerase sigma-70 factor (ECF subfamily)